MRGGQNMASATSADLRQQLGRLFRTGSAVGLTDRELVERFALRPDEAGAAFEALMARHGSMVLTVCRQVLGDSHAAEDAFQATFLVMIRRSGSLRVRQPGSLGPWLHGVAYRIALKTRQGASRRRARECRLAVAAISRPSAVVEDGELRALLHDEVNQLPAKYRAPVVLCYFEGRTHDEAGAALRWPVGTVRGRLARARDLLRSRLTRRGYTPEGWLGAYLLKPAGVEPTARLLEATVAAAIGRMAATTRVAVLANLMLRSLFMARLRMTLAAVLTVVLLGAGARLVVRGALAVKPQATALSSSPVAVGQVQPMPVDLLGDPLPKHARARLGNIRFHHADSVGKALYTRDGKSLVSTDGSGVVRVWDAATGRIIRKTVDPLVHFRDLALSTDGTTLATAEDPSRLRLWDLATGRELRRWHGAKESYGYLDFSPDGRTLAACVSRFDETTKKNETFINLWDTAAGTERRHRLVADWLSVNDIKISPDGKTLATASNDSESNIIGEKPERGSTRLWDLASYQERLRFPVAGSHVRSVAFSPDGHLVAAAVTDQTIRVYDSITGEERVPRLGRDKTLGPKPQQNAPIVPRAVAPDTFGDRDPMVITCLAFSPDGSILASGCSGSGHAGSSAVADVYLWDLAQRKELRHFAADQAGIQSLRFSPDGRTLASTGAEPIIRVWDVATGRETFAHSGHRGWIRKLAFSPADGTVFTAGQDGTIRQWEPASGRELGIFATFASPIDAIAFAPDGKTLLLGGSFGGLALWSVAERREIRRLPRIEERNPIQYVAFSPNGKTVASERRIWDTASGKVLVTFRDLDERINRLANFYRIFYSPDGKQIVTAERNGVRVWDIASGKELRWVLRSENFHSYASALSPDGRFLARGGRVAKTGGQVDPTIRLIEMASGQEVATFEGDKEGTRDLAFSADGRFLASGGGSNDANSDATVRVWDMATSRELRRFAGHLAAVNSLAFSPDGRSLISASADATALVWDLSDLTDHPQAAKVLLGR
jgi:RNA polymerase sigma factor (sigma-70 family)